MAKNKILLEIQKTISFSYKQCEEIFERTGSYDAVIKLHGFSCETNIHYCELIKYFK